MAQKLPLGLQDFREIISGGYKYIDKTRYIYEMCSTGKYYFMSRPRRFGKSMTVSTLHELYSGSRELFKGLWIEDRWDWDKRNPVLRFNFTGIGFAQIGLIAALDYQLNMRIQDLGAPIPEADLYLKFEYLIRQSAKNGKVVVLIDEYDAPITRYIGKEIETAQANRDILRDFFAVLQNNDSLLELVFITGVSSFPKVDICSTLNDLNDITISSEFSTMSGFTQEELEYYFAAELEQSAKKLDMAVPNLLAELERWYKGFRFHPQSETVYNPGSVGLFFATKEFKNFWFQTGTPSFLVRFIEKEGLHGFNPSILPKENLLSFGINSTNIDGLLFQTGYLSIQSYTSAGDFALNYPNLEVERSMEGCLMELGASNKGKVAQW
jgi:Predicted AAA-ATPase